MGDEEQHNIGAEEEGREDDEETAQASQQTSPGKRERRGARQAEEAGVDGMCGETQKRGEGEESDRAMHVVRQL